MRIVRRAQQKKTMKNRIKQLRSHLTEMRGAAIVAFQAGRESILKATEGMEYGVEYTVSPGQVGEMVGSCATSPADPVGVSGWPVMAGLTVEARPAS